MKKVLGSWRLLAALAVLACIPACKAKPTLVVNTPFMVRVGTYPSAEIRVVAEEEKSAPYANRLATALMVKLRELETFQKTRLPSDEGTSEIRIQVTILDLKKASRVNWGWYTRNTSRVEADIQVIDVAKGQTLSAFQVVAKPRYSSIEEAIDDCAQQIASYIRQNK